MHDFPLRQDAWKRENKGDSKRGIEEVESVVPKTLDERKRKAMLSAVRAAVNKSRESLDSQNE